MVETIEAERAKLEATRAPNANHRPRARPTVAEGFGQIPVVMRGLRGADDGVRTRDLRLGKPTLYQLSYIRATGQRYHD